MNKILLKYKIYSHNFHVNLKVNELNNFEISHSMSNKTTLTIIFGRTVKETVQSPNNSNHDE